MRGVLLLVGAICLGGCGAREIASTLDAKANFRTSSEQYRSCIAANPANPDACNGQRALMEADERIVAAHNGQGANVTIRQR